MSGLGFKGVRMYMLLVIAQQLLKEKLWYVHATQFLKHVIPISTPWV